MWVTWVGETDDTVVTRDGDMGMSDVGGGDMGR